MATARHMSPLRDGYDHNNSINSPDPLAETVDTSHVDETNVKKRGPARTRKNSTVTTPPSMKSVIDHNISPWRIRVTLEAEPDFENTDGTEKRGKQQTRTVTKTIKVPLRDASGAGQRSPQRKTRQKSPGGGRRSNLTDLDAVVLGDDNEEAEWISSQKSPGKRGVRKSKAHHTSGDTSFDVQADSDGAGRVANTFKQPPVQAQNAALDSRKVSVNSAMGYPTPSPTASEHGHSDDRDRHIGMDTVMESEGFTMIDLDSVPSIQRLRNSPTSSLRQGQLAADTNATGGEERTVHTLTDDSNLSGSNRSADSNFISSPPEQLTNKTSTTARPLKPYKVGHLELPSSTRISRNRLVTPMPPQPIQAESPQLPSPPRSRVNREQNHTSSSQAQRAAQTLQREVTPETDDRGSERSSSGARGETLFGGYSATARRDLRAELRYGEELASREPRRLASGFQPNQDVFPRVQHKEAEWQAERDEIVKAANTKGSDVITIEDEVEENLHDETTVGDIWLAEARTHTSSPHEQQSISTEEISQAKENVGPRRNLIPSPWKRGEQIEDTSNVSDSTVSGLFWKEGPSQADRAGFGAAVLSKPSSQPSKVPAFTRRVRDEFEDAKHDDITERDMVENWREASDIVEEETSELENQLVSPVVRRQAQEAYLTQLYETNLEDVPEQDLASPSKQLGTNSVSAHSDEELTDSEGDFGLGGVPTPRSALKGSRANFAGELRSAGTRVGQNGSAETRVAWAKRSSCMNEDWEESTRSVRSTQESSSMDDTPTLSTVDGRLVNQDDTKLLSKCHQGGEDLEIRGQHSLAEADKEKPWFRRLKETDQEANLPHIDKEGAFEPTSKHTFTAGQPRALPRHTHQQGQEQKDRLRQLQHQPKTGTKRETERETGTTTRIPSYLLPPSYPSLPTRDSSTPLPTSGSFTTPHLQTLHIIHRKSLRPRFHAPLYPSEIRAEILQLVENKFSVTVDESDTLEEEFVWRFGEGEARVIERFMREVEWGYHVHVSEGHGEEEKKKGRGVEWGWTVEEVAERLGWIVIGEVVRGIEKERTQRQ